MFKFIGAANSSRLQSSMFALFCLFLFLGIAPTYAISINIFQADTIAFMKKVNGAQNLVKTNPDSVLEITNQISIDNQKLLNKGKESGSVLVKAEALCLKGRALRYKGELTNAENCLDSSLVIFNECRNYEGIARSTHELGVVYYYSGQYDAALVTFKKAIHLRDSLNLQSDLAKSQTNLGIIYNRLGFVDSAEYFHKKSLRIREELNDTAGMTASLNNLGNIYSVQSDYKQAIDIYMRALSLIDSAIVSRKLASLYNNVGYIYMNQANYTNALMFFHKAYSCYDILGDLKGSAQVMLNIGNINFDIGIFEHAQSYTSQALSTFMLAENTQGISDSYFQLGRIYIAEKKVDRAQRFFMRALELTQEINDRRGIGDCYQNLGVIFQEKMHFDSAEYSFKKAYAYYDSLNYVYGLATVYNNLGQLHYKTERMDKCIESANNSLKYSLNYDGFIEQIDSYSLLSKAYEKKGYFKKSLAYLNSANHIKDSIFDNNTTQSLVELEVKYQSRNLQRTMEKQQLMLSKREAEIVSNQREYLLQRRIRNLLILASLVLGLLLIWNFRVLLAKKQNNKQLKLQKDDILNKNVELGELNEELRSQRSQIEIQNEELVQQKEDIELINFHLNKDIKYANYIQQAILPSKVKLKSIVPEHFVLYKPKELVGGDFYYVTKINNVRLIAVGDCTGHGVPGGFLTMLGLSLLKSIINEKNINNPSEILNQLRRGIVESFEQTGQLLEQSDGIDIAIAVIDEISNKMLFSGGRGNAVVTNGSNFSQLLKGDRIAVSFTPTMRSFSTQTFLLTGNENIYLYTDGFTDQFNAQNMKFGRKRFVSLCEELCEKPFTVQKENFSNAFEIWRNEVEQIDDALVFAFKALV